jgi:osmotically-inducible protein OsmY
VNQKYYYFLYLCFVIFLKGCSPFSMFSSGVASLDTTSQERGLGGYVTDQEIKTRINVVFFEHDHLLHHKVDVNVYEGRVLLTGHVKDKKMQEDAIRLAWQVPGVKAVMNETTIEDARTIIEYAQDKWISTKLHALLFFNKHVGSRNYEIIVSRGIVYLTGIAKDQKELNEVIHTVRTTKHVKKVVSYARLMDIYETRRRKIFNDRKHPSPLADKQTERKKVIFSEKRNTSWPSSRQKENSSPQRDD